MLFNDDYVHFIDEVYELLGLTYLTGRVLAGRHILCLFGNVYTVAHVPCRSRNLSEFDGPRVSH